MKKSKSSNVKKTNKKMTKLKRQGKLRHKRNKKVVVKAKQVAPKPEEPESEVESDHGQDMLSMVEQDDLDFLKRAVVEGKYSMFQDRSFKRDRKVIKRQMAEDDETIEADYEGEREGGAKKRTRMLLPIKTKTGLVRRTIEEDGTAK